MYVKKEVSSIPFFRKKERKKITSNEKNLVLIHKNCQSLYTEVGVFFRMSQIVILGCLLNKQILL